MWCYHDPFFATVSKNFSLSEIEKYFILFGMFKVHFYVHTISLLCIFTLSELYLILVLHYVVYVVECILFILSFSKYYKIYFQDSMYVALLTNIFVTYYVIFFQFVDLFSTSEYY